MMFIRIHLVKGIFGAILIQRSWKEGSSKAILRCILRDPIYICEINLKYVFRIFAICSRTRHIESYLVQITFCSFSRAKYPVLLLSSSSS